MVELYCGLMEPVILSEKGTISFRHISFDDNKALAAVIRKTLEEFGVNRPGTVYTDPTTDDLYTLFKTTGSIYFVVERNGEILGGAGIFPTEGLPLNTCEFVKFYLKAEIRGKGYGKTLLQKASCWAAGYGYKQIYLESLLVLSKAVSIYEQAGFKSIDHPLGNSGHSACDVWMLKCL